MNKKINAYLPDLLRQLADKVERAGAGRPQGKWIKNDLGLVICSQCKRTRRDNRINHINFCNSCGARMKGADDE